jgi:hypothetical protein
VAKKDAVNPRLLAAARTRVIFGLRGAPQLTPAEYRDYLSWVHIMVDVERQRMARRGAKQALLPVVELEVAALEAVA